MDMQSGRSPCGGLVCHQGELTAPKICVSSPGSASGGKERFHRGLEQVGEDLSFSSLDADFKGFEPVANIQRTSDPGGSSLASPDLVPAASVSCHVFSPNPKSLPDAEGGVRDLLLWVCSETPPSRLDFIRELMSREFSRETVETWQESHRHSSKRQY